MEYLDILPIITGLSWAYGRTGTLGWYKVPRRHWATDEDSQKVGGVAPPALAELWPPEASKSVFTLGPHSYQTGGSCHYYIREGTQQEPPQLQCKHRRNPVTSGGQTEISYIATPASWPPNIKDSSGVQPEKV